MQFFDFMIERKISWGKMWNYVQLIATICKMRMKKKITEKEIQIDNNK